MEPLYMIIRSGWHAGTQISRDINVTGFHLNIDGVYLGTVWCDSEDMVQWSSSLQVRAFAIPFRCFMAVADVYIRGATARVMKCLPAVWTGGRASVFLIELHLNGVTPESYLTEMFTRQTCRCLASHSHAAAVKHTSAAAAVMKTCKAVLWKQT